MIRPRSTWGGARRGAGRPPRGPRRTAARASSPHKARPPVTEHVPVHVTAYVARDVGPLRSARARRALRGAIDHARSLAAGRADFTIVRLRSDPSRVELLVRAHDANALARGMQGFQIAAARALNVALGRRGSVFPDRYRIRRGT